MKKFFANKVAILFNLALLTLLFFYPVANLTGKPEPDVNVDMATKLLPVNLNVDSRPNLTLYSADSSGLKADTAYQAQNTR